MKRPFIIYEDYKHMSAFEISAYYKKIKKKRRVLCTIPLVVLLGGVFIYGLRGWAGYAAIAMSASLSAGLGTAGIFHYIFFAAGAAMQSTDDKKLTIYGAVLMAVYNILMPIFAMIVLEELVLQTVPMVFLVYLSFTAYLHVCFINEQEFIRSLPDELKDVRVEQEKRHERMVEEIKKTNVPTKAYEEYDATKTEQVLSALPKRSYEPYKAVQDNIDEIDEVFQGDISARRIDRRIRIKDPAMKFKGDIGKVAEKEYVEFDAIDTSFGGDFKRKKKALPKNDDDSEETDISMESL